MSIRISLYDFFAYTIPGIFYIFLAAFGLDLFNVIPLDFTLLSDLSLFIFLLLAGTSYVIGQLLDTVAYRWMRLLRGRNRIAREKAHHLFHERYPWIQLHFQPDEWAILLQGLKIQSPDVAADIEQLNAISIMLRNISLGLLIAFLIFLLTFIIVNMHIGNLALAALALVLSYVALDRCDIRRRWFYLHIFEAVAMKRLLQEKSTLATKIQIKQQKLAIMPQGDQTDLRKEGDSE